MQVPDPSSSPRSGRDHPSQTPLGPHHALACGSLVTLHSVQLDLAVNLRIFRMAGPLLTLPALWALPPHRLDLTVQHPGGPQFPSRGPAMEAPSSLCRASRGPQATKMAVSLWATAMGPRCWPRLSPYPWEMLTVQSHRDPSGTCVAPVPSGATPRRPPPTLPAQGTPLAPPGIWVGIPFLCLLCT